MAPGLPIAVSLFFDPRTYMQFSVFALFEALAVGFCLAMVAPWALLAAALARKILFAFSPKQGTAEIFRRTQFQTSSSLRKASKSFVGRGFSHDIPPEYAAGASAPEVPIHPAQRNSNHLLTSLPALLLPAAALAFGRTLSDWQYMWLSAFAIFLGVKWLTWCSAPRGARKHFSRSIAYFFLWPGMDARAFLFGAAPAKPAAKRFLWPLTKIAIGIALLWILPRHIPAVFPLLRGWSGLFGLVLLLHFGSFEFLALIWQCFGINAVPIMQAPLSSRSLNDFWGQRWNLGFRQLSHEFIFGPLVDRIGAPVASLLVFLFSGLIHELVISVPARAGYGLPTLYFFLQGAGVALERSSLGRALSLRRGISGWAFTAAITAFPAFWLFHPAFVVRVVIPFMEAIKSL